MKFLLMIFVSMSLTALADSVKKSPTLDGIINVISAGDFRGPIEVNPEGFERAKAKVYFPNQYETRENWPLVVLLHGFKATAEEEDLYMTLRFRTSRRGFILLTPQGTPTPNGTRSAEGEDYSGKQFWNATDFCCDFAKTKVDDVKYLNSLIDFMATHYRIDQKRIYLIGHSNGGFMANRLACENGERFAAIASLAGGSFKNPAACRHPTPVSYLQIHAEDDQTVVFGDDPQYAGGQATVQQWMDKDHCVGAPTTAKMDSFPTLFFGPKTQLQSWDDCQSGKTLALWKMLPHPGVHYDPHIPNLTWFFSERVLDFLFAHQL